MATIYKLERESEAWNVINTLHSLYDGANSVVLWLRDTSRTISTVDIIDARNGWSGIHAQLNDFNNSHGSWFKTAWPDYYDALTGAISSLATIIDAVNNGLHDWYWDYDTDKPIISDIIQEHRNALADLIEAEMEQ